jgi:pimeloyl-ACP methyl ester carboxylesterase
VIHFQTASQGLLFDLGDRLMRNFPEYMEIQVNGYRMNYRQSGNGLPVLLIHGYPLNSRLWKPQLEGLADVAHLIAPDLRGHGDSESVPGPYSMDLLADDCAALLEALDISTPVIVNGLSMGGYIAMAFARRYPERLAGLVLTATRSGADSEAGKTARDQAAKQAREAGCRFDRGSDAAQTAGARELQLATGPGRGAAGDHEQHLPRRCAWRPGRYENPS